jgi:hypothetical protein
MRRPEHDNRGGERGDEPREARYRLTFSNHDFTSVSSA